MTVRQVIILLVACTAVCIAAMFLLPRSAEATNDPNCYTQDELEADALANNGTIAGAAYYDGVTTDATVIIQGAREILAFGFKDGCLIGMTAIDFRAAPKGSPA